MATTIKRTDYGLQEAKRCNNGIERSDKWDIVHDAYIKKHPTCAVCDSINNVQAHHIFPFHYCIALGRPDLELDDRNLITLCETEGHDHHLLIGHFDDFKSSNMNVKTDAIIFHDFNKNNLKENKNWMFVKQSRLKPFDQMTNQEKVDLTKRMNATFPKI